MSDFELTISLISLGALLLVSGFFSGSETGLTAISRARIFKLEKEGHAKARWVRLLRARKEDLIGTVLLGNNLVNIGASALATALAIRLWGEESLVYVTLGLTLLVLVFAEVLPKTFAINNPEKVALGVAPVFVLLVKLFAPFTAVVQRVINGTLRLFGVDLKAGTTLISAADALRGTIELQHHEGDIVKEDRDMLGGVLDLANIGVGDVITHRKNVITIEATLPVPEIIRLAVESEHSRIPLWSDDPDNIVGTLHIRDLMKTVQQHGMEQISHEMILEQLQKPWFVPESTTLRDQLLNFRNQRQHFAWVVDEYGALLGILTLEDILEEIVGEIDDEHDAPDEFELLHHPDGGYVVEGSMTIRDLNRELDWDLPDENATTIAGLVLHEAQVIPEVGQEFSFFGRLWVVLEKEGNRLVRLHITPVVAEDIHDDDEL